MLFKVYFLLVRIQKALRYLDLRGGLTNHIVRHSNAVLYCEYWSIGVVLQSYAHYIIGLSSIDNVIHVPRTPVVFEFGLAIAT